MSTTAASSSTEEDARSPASPSSLPPAPPRGSSRPPATSQRGMSSPPPQWAHVGYHRTTIPPEATFDEANGQIRRDLLRMIVQYLQQEGFTMSSATIQDEANVKLLEKQHDKDALRRVTKAIQDGDWDLVAKLLHKHLKKFHAQQGFLYAVCKQEYLELIDRQEYQKAFTFLTTHLKPLEKVATMTNRNEFKELCYLLTCKSVGEAEAFRDWEGVAKSREALVEQLRATFELDELITTGTTPASNGTISLANGGAMAAAVGGGAGGSSSASSTSSNGGESLANGNGSGNNNGSNGNGNGNDTGSDEARPLEFMPENRLLRLLHQSVAYQMEFSRYHPKTVPKVTTLLRDFECEVLPNCVKSTYVGHSQNVKHVTFVGQEGEFLASGSSDTTIRLWPVEFPSGVDSQGSASTHTGHLHSNSQSHGRPEARGETCRTWSRELQGHSSRIWYMAGNTAGDRLFSASGDGTVKIWDIRNALAGLSQDLEAFAEHDQGQDPDQDPGRGQGATTLADTRPTTSRFTMAAASTTGGEDMVGPSVDCVATLGNGQAGGDIYSVNLHPSETHLVTGGYDQTVRLYDISTGVNVKTFRGHVASVCDAQFNRHANLLVSGSKDGTIRLWDILSGLCVHTLRQTLGEVTSVTMASNGFLLLSGSRNNSNRLWDMRMLNAPRTQLQTGMGGPVHGSSSTNTAASVTGGGGGVTTGNGGHGGGVSIGLGRGGGGSIRTLQTQAMEHKPVQRFKGHQNTAKNVVRASFGPREAFVLGGSEDGCVYVWDVATGKLLEKMAGHQGVTYNAKWHERQALMASSSHDGTVKTWWWQDKKR